MLRTVQYFHINYKGARFGPNAIREASRLTRPATVSSSRDLFSEGKVADFGDVFCHPFDGERMIVESTASITDLLSSAPRLVFLGGDHTMSYPVL